MTIASLPTIQLDVRRVPRLGTDGFGRADRIIHGLDGLDTPADGHAVTDAAAALWSRCTQHLDLDASPDFLLGLEAGGIIPAVGVAMVSGIPFKIAWKLQLALDGAIQFLEPHSTRRDMYAYGIAPGQRILIVDDAITTGRTIANLVRVLREAGAEPIGVACLIEDIQHGGRNLLEDLGVPLVSLTVLD